MRILFVTSYPPPFDARSRAAADHVKALRTEGHHVEVLSPAPSAALHHHELDSWRALGPMIGLFRGFDRVIVADELGSAAPLRAAFRAARSVDPWRAPTAPPQPAVHPDVTWPSERDAAMTEIRDRAARRRIADPSHAGGDLSARLRRVPPLALPASESARPGAGTAKRVVRRLTGWQVDPLVARINLLRSTLIDVFETVEQRDDR